MDHKFLSSLEDKPVDDESEESMEASAITSICTVFENTLVTLNGTPNEHILGVISVLFLKLGMYMLFLSLQRAFCSDCTVSTFAFALLLLC